MPGKAKDNYCSGIQRIAHSEKEKTPSRSWIIVKVNTSYVRLLCSAGDSLTRANAASHRSFPRTHNLCIGGLEWQAREVSVNSFNI